MIYDAPCSLPGASFAHLPIYGLEDLGFGTRGEAGAFIAERNTAPGGRLQLNTNAGGLSYAFRHVRVAGESVRQMRGTAPAPDPQRQDLGLPRCYIIPGIFSILPGKCGFRTGNGKANQTFATQFPVAV